jgi:CHAD domain-containing protein
VENQKNIWTGFRISKRENLKENINRILLEQIDYILEHCDGKEEDVHVSIHEIRKSIKRIRAVLRLIREEIGYSSYYRENLFYRDLSRSISDIRTHDVLLHTLEGLKSDMAAPNTREAFAPIIDSINVERKKLLSGMLSRDRLLQDLSSRFMEARKRIHELSIEQDGFEVFSGGFYRTYRQGKNYLKSARKNHNMHLMHNMRKRTKYLWYQVEIIRPIYPGPLKAFSSSLENISEKLGQYHDLSELSSFLKEYKGASGFKQTLLDACAFKKDALLPGILRMSEAAYAEKPEALINRMNEYWRIYYRQT